MKPEIWSIFYEAAQVNRENATIELPIGDFEELEDHIDTLLEEQARLRKMLYDMTSRIDWVNAGSSLDEYDALVKEFEPKQGE